MKKEKEEKSPFGCDEGGLAAKRVFFMSVIAGDLIVTISFFFQENKSHGVEPFALVLCLHAC
jgi:hypothetical protein